ncbi:holin family protein [Mesobacterium sp. TK19101]|uniref:Holin family protein n=1 Tax=Mesobacterium hydrothermale TaxID=3111907 RepID=A0ABU6HDI2_9RHOB|nr:holin family protein [Mesobacterium sp. TK19101]MEC3860446.1 holin family protein [Mesobacterium sp. TK19101]
MGLIERVLTLVFGADRNVIAETAEVFRVNAEAEAKRGADLQGAALRQFAAEFSCARSGWFDRMIDGLNRIPRPALALGTLGLFVAAMVDPIWFGARMTGLALVPDPLWWLLGAIVSFYFGARHQAKGQDFQRDIARALAASVPQVIDSAQRIEALRPDGPEPPAAPDNPALADWQALATK